MVKKHWQLICGGLILVATLIASLTPISAADKKYHSYPETTTLHDASRLLVYEKMDNYSGSKNISGAALKASIASGLAPVASTNDYDDLDNTPTLLRGYDGRDIELQMTAFYIQWRYAGDTIWTDLVPLTAITGPTGQNGVTMACTVTGGIRTLLYDAAGENPAPIMAAFGLELRKNGDVVTPESHSWTVPASGSLLSGASSEATFIPTVNGTFSAGSADNRVDVTVAYQGSFCAATAPISITKIGATGESGAADSKQDIYTKIGVATTGDVLNTEAGTGDADGFAFRTVRAKGGDIHRTDLAVGQTWIHARPTDTATTPKFGIKDSSGTPTATFNADGSFTGTLVIR
jgi:hypothetical protein